MVRCNLVARTVAGEMLVSDERLLFVGGGGGLAGGGGGSELTLTLDARLSRRLAAVFVS